MSPNRVIIELEAQTILPMREAAGARLRCIEGTVWITEEGNRNDFVLAPGDTHDLAGDGEALVQAIGPARVALESASEAGSSGKDRRQLMPRLLLEPA